MSGIHMALLGSGGALGPVVTVGQTTLTVKSTTFYYYGYDGALAAPATNFGSIANGTFNGATVKAIMSVAVNSPGNADYYTVVFDGNRSAGFFNTLTVNNTLVVGTLSAPSYSAGNNETSFSVTLGTAAATLFGTTNGVLIPTLLT